MRTLSIDIETYSSVDLITSGVYAYVDAPDFNILLFAYAYDDEPVQIIDLASDENVPGNILIALTDDNVIKTAYNANFEITCISRHFNINLPVTQWRCSSVHALELGLPQTLSMVAQTLGLQEQKDSRGKALIKYFSVPCKETIVNGGRTRNLPHHDVDKWQVFKEYCIQDVEVERAIRKKLEQFPLHKNEQRLWEYDQAINSRGVLIDTDFVNSAIAFGNRFSDVCNKRAKELTNLDNPNSVAQLKEWLLQNTGEEVESLNKESVKQILKENDDELVQEVLQLRANMAKTSNKKYSTMIRCKGQDNRIRGLLQFYGASRTGRWAGRLVQVQNLPQNHLKDLEIARELVLSNDYEMFELCYGDVPKVLSELIRTAFIPSNGHRFIVSDFSAIEARVIAYLAGEQWRIDVFNSHGKIYEASASQMFKVPIERIGKGSPLRQKGKIAELALGYGGSVGALTQMGALNMGLFEDELQPLVNTWRSANPMITKFWHTTEQAVKDAINDKPSTLPNGISFIKKSGILFITLPSGRNIAYVKPQIGTNKFGNPSITYMGMNQTSKRWERVDTFGGKLVENIVQAFARDCLAESIIKLEDKGFKVNFHVHDEVVLDIPNGTSSVEEITNIMGESIAWAKGLPLRADGYECEFYKKD